jgi:hypothetical protein
MVRSAEDVLLTVLPTIVSFFSARLDGAFVSVDFVDVFIDFLHYRFLLVKPLKYLIVDLLDHFHFF